MGGKHGHMGHAEPCHHGAEGEWDARGEIPAYSKENPVAGWDWESPRIQTAYAGQIADWLDGSLADHPCNVGITPTPGSRCWPPPAGRAWSRCASTCRSPTRYALTRDGADVFARLHTDLPETPLLRPLD